MYKVAGIGTFEGKTALNLFLKDNNLKEEDLEIEQELVVEPEQNAYHSVDMMMSTIINDLGNEPWEAFLTGGGNFRFDTYPAYKGGRKARPELYSQIRDYLIHQWDAEVVHGMEADDRLGINQTRSPEEYCIATIDKDLDTIIGWHYDFVKKEKYFVTPDQAEYCLYSQMCTGDSSDNVCGIRGVGPAAVKKMFKDKDPKTAAQEAYQRFWGEDWEEVWECNYKLLRILDA